MVGHPRTRCLIPETTEATGRGDRRLGRIDVEKPCDHHDRRRRRTDCQRSGGGADHPLVSGHPGGGMGLRRRKAVLRLLEKRVRQHQGQPGFEYDGAPYTVRLFYITNEPRSLLVGLEKWGSTANATLPADAGLAFMVDGVRFDLSDVTRSPGEGAVAWDDSGLDWTNGQIVSVQLVGGATSVPTLPLAGAGLLALLLGVSGYRRLAVGLVVPRARRERP